MGRMLEALKQGDRPTRDKHFFEDSLERDAHHDLASDDSVPFIEVGPNKKLEGSPQVLAAKHPPQTKLPAPHIAPEKAEKLDKPEKKTLKADLIHPEPLTVAFEPWPTLPRIAQGIAPEIVAYHHPDHPVSQQYASLVEKMTEGSHQSQVLLLVGSKPQVGTSTVLLNLAVAAAQQVKRRPVVIDAHLRRPGLAQRLGYAQSPSLQDVLQGKLALEQAVVRTAVNNLHLVPTHATATPPTLTPDAFRWLFGWLRERFDLILVDGPGLDAPNELAALAPLCDGTYLVLPQGENAQTQRTVTHTLGTMSARIRGLIHTHRE